MKKIVLLIVACLAFRSVNAQLYEGASLNFGFAVGQGSSTAYNRVFNEFNDLRPWLDHKADLPKGRYGFSVGLLGHSGSLIFGLNLSGFKTATSVHGIDSAGHELIQTFILKNSGFEMMYGFCLVNKEKFRIVPMFGLAFYNAILKSSDKKAAQRWGMTALRILFMTPGSSVKTIDDHFFMGARMGVSFAFGEHNAIALEPFYVLPFWKVNANKTRDILNNDQPSAYPDRAFKSYISQWGVRMSFCFGFSN